VFAYEIDFGDVGTASTGESMGASHVGSWNLTPVATLDANRAGAAANRETRLRDEPGSHRGSDH